MQQAATERGDDQPAVEQQAKQQEMQRFTLRPAPMVLELAQRIQQTATPNFELEARLGTLMERKAARAVYLPIKHTVQVRDNVFCFESRLSPKIYARIVKRLEQQAAGHPGSSGAFERTDYHMNDLRYSITNGKTAQLIRKVKVLRGDYYCPGGLHFRISGATETPFKMTDKLKVPTQHGRQKHTLTYRWGDFEVHASTVQVAADVSPEYLVEVELVNSQRLQDALTGGLLPLCNLVTELMDHVTRLQLFASQ